MLAFIEFEIPEYVATQTLKTFRRVVEQGIMELRKEPALEAWISKITGFDPKYFFSREFIVPRKCFSRANSKMSRGVYYQWWLESGQVYDIFDGNKKRFFCWINNEGEIIQIDKNQAIEMVSQNADK